MTNEEKSLLERAKEAVQQQSRRAAGERRRWYAKADYAEDLCLAWVEENENRRHSVSLDTLCPSYDITFIFSEEDDIPTALLFLEELGIELSEHQERKIFTSYERIDEHVFLRFDTDPSRKCRVERVTEKRTSEHTQMRIVCD